MKHVQIILLFLCLQTALTASATFYVKSGGTGSGLNWKDAAGDLSAVLFAAQAGDRIFVARGLYYPTEQADNKFSFTLNPGVQLFGGFAGNESSPSERRISENLTILSGEVNSLSSADNSQTVLLISAASEKILLDGFIIQDGNANGGQDSRDAERSGGAVYIQGSRFFQTAQVSLKNCVFKNNTARDGGAVFIENGAGVIFENCLFKNNSADFDGGAVFIERRLRSENLLSFINCSFSENKATYGGAVCAYSGGDCDLLFLKCDFLNNTARTRGHSLHQVKAYAECDMDLNSCRIIEGPAARTVEQTMPQEKEKEWSN